MILNLFDYIVDIELPLDEISYCIMIQRPFSLVGYLYILLKGEIFFPYILKEGF